MADAQVAEAVVIHAAADAERVLQCEQVSYWLLMLHVLTPQLRHL